MGIMLTSAIGPNVSITHLILPMALSHVFDRSIRCIGLSARARAKRRFSVLVDNASSPTVWHSIAGFNRLVMQQG
jgi:hypothetical protein